MTSHRERVLDYIKRFPGRDDDEIAAALEISPRQTVNMICRRLANAQLVRRERGARGKLANFPAVESTTAVLPGEPSSRLPTPTAVAKRVMDGLSEDEVKAALVGMLEADGWTVEVAWGKRRGIDVVAVRESERWLIECKGHGSRPEMQNNYFVGVLGELLQRMSAEDAKHSLAFPDVPKFRRLWSELPRPVKSKLGLTALFVASNGTVVELAE